MKLRVTAHRNRICGAALWRNGGMTEHRKSLMRRKKREEILFRATTRLKGLLHAGRKKTGFTIKKTNQKAGFAIKRTNQKRVQHH